MLCFEDAYDKKQFMDKKGADLSNDYITMEGRTLNLSNWITRTRPVNAVGKRSCRDRYESRGSRTRDRRDMECDDRRDDSRGSRGRDNRRGNKRDGGRDDRIDDSRGSREPRGPRKQEKVEERTRKRRSPSTTRRDRSFEHMAQRSSSSYEHARPQQYADAPPMHMEYTHTARPPTGASLMGAQG